MVAKLKTRKVSKPEISPPRATPVRIFPGGLMDQVLGILDSKIQYQEFKINQAVKSYVDISPIYNKDNQNRFKPILENNLRVLEVIDKANHIIKLIFIIRNKINHGNAKIILNLISKERFEHFTVKNLTEFFDKPWMQNTRV